MYNRASAARPTAPPAFQKAAAIKMSLKAFHFILIIASTVFAFGFGLWCFLDFRTSGSIVNLIMGVLSLLGGIGLTVYAFYASKKLKDYGYL